MLEIKNLKINFPQNGAISWAVRGISFTAQKGKITGIVGESGSGKSMTALAITGLLPPQADTTGEMVFDGKTLHFGKSNDWDGLRGTKISIVFQDPTTSLNPLIPVGRQVAEPLRIHTKLSAKAAEKETIRLFSTLGILPAILRVTQYPHQLSGGLQQRVILAAAIACKPQLLIADEPTTALDVTVQAQILKLLRTYVEQERASLCLISHDLGVIAQLADEVIVMCEGSIVEKGSVYEILKTPLHPYTQLLLTSLPRIDQPLKLQTFNDVNLTIIGGGCVFTSRCPKRRAICMQVVPENVLAEDGRTVKCHFSKS